MASVGIDALFDVQGADRTARSYAFLYAAYKRSEVSDSPVRDAIDCLSPFIVAYLNQNAGQQVNLEKLQVYLRETFDFDIPLYALEQLLPSLIQAGNVTYDKKTKIYVAKGGKDDFKVAKEEIETDFNLISNRLKEYAKEIGANIEPSSGSWGNGLITFLKSNTGEEPKKVTSHKGVLLDARDIEASIIASFIQNIYFREPNHFEAILRVFMGTLIEEFISTISQVEHREGFRNLTAFYDTSVLLRVLGCSGTLLRIATDELTRYLQDLGIQIAFFSGNEAEVQGVLSAIISTRDFGGEVWGETASAISKGEVSIADLRLMQNSIVEQLARKGIFPADTAEGEAQRLAQYQIDERGFVDFLAAEAMRRNKNYSIQNLRNDASYLGNIMRLRKGMRTRDLSEARSIFITTNKLYAKVARRFLIETGVYKGIHTPAVLSVGQVATIAWLMREHKIDPKKAGRELLSNCYAAVRPDAEWFQNFRSAIEKVVGNLETYADIPENKIKLQAARRIAQDQSFGNATLVRNLNIAEVLSLAEKSAEEEKERIRKEAEELAQEAAKEARSTGRDEAINSRWKSDEKRARKGAKFIRKMTFAPLLLITLLFTALYDQAALFKGRDLFIALLQLIFLIPTVIATLDLFGVNLVKKTATTYEHFVFKGLFKLIAGENWSDRK